MLLALSSDQELFRETTAKLLDELVPVGVLRGLRDDADGFDAGYWRRGADLGWTSLLVDEHHGAAPSAERGWSTWRWWPSSSGVTLRPAPSQ